MDAAVPSADKSEHRIQKLDDEVVNRIAAGAHTFVASKRNDKFNYLQGR